MGAPHSDAMKGIKLRKKQRLLAEKARLGLSDNDFAKLIGVTSKSVLGWQVTGMRAPHASVDTIDEWLRQLRAMEPDPEVVTNGDVVRPVTLSVTVDLSEMEWADLRALQESLGRELDRRMENR